MSALKAEPSHLYISIRRKPSGCRGKTGLFDSQYQAQARFRAYSLVHLSGIHDTVVDPIKIIHSFTPFRNPFLVLFNHTWYRFGIGYRGKDEDRPNKEAGKGGLFALSVLDTWPGRLYINWHRTLLSPSQWTPNPQSGWHSTHPPQQFSPLAISINCHIIPLIPKFKWMAIVIYISSMTQSSSSTPKRRDRDRSRSEDRQQITKLFVTNLDGKAETKELQDELRRLFEKCGTVENIVAKRNKNSEYCFAFAEMKDHAAAAECVKNYDQSSLNGKQIKVEFQDDSKRRKDSNKGCYNCGKMGHFARECHSSRPDERGSRHRGRYSRSRSRSEDSDRHKKPKRRHRSDSSDRGRSRSPKSKKDRKNRSRDRDERKSKKKHKKSRSSDS